MKPKPMRMAAQKQRTWRDWHDISPELFPLPLELREAEHPGSIGVLLQKIPLELVRDSNRSPNPWLDLASMKFIAHYRSLFLSCASVMDGWSLLSSFGWGGATGAKKDSRLTQRAKAARQQGNESEAIRLGKKNFDAMLRYDPDLLTKLAEEIGGETYQGLGAVIAESRARNRRPVLTDARKRARAKLMETYPVQILLLTNWIRHGLCGDPSWCFFTNKALANLLCALGWSVSHEQVEQICVRLGLPKPDDEFLIISDAKFDAKSGAILLNLLPPKRARVEFPKDAWTVRAPIYLGKRKFYEGIAVQES